MANIAEAIVNAQVERIRLQSDPNAKANRQFLQNAVIEAQDSLVEKLATRITDRTALLKKEGHATDDIAKDSLIKWYHSKLDELTADK